MSKEVFKDQQFLTGLFGGIAVISTIGLIVMAIAYFNVSNNGVAPIVNVPNQNAVADNQPAAPQDPQAVVAGVNSFLEKKGATACKEGGKPVVYLFSTTSCPHCTWVGPIFDAAVKKYADKIQAYHWQVDTGDNTLTSAVETQVPSQYMSVYTQFNPEGSIPTLVFGCKYYRIGTANERTNDTAAEGAEFEALIKELTK